MVYREHPLVRRSGTPIFAGGTDLKPPSASSDLASRFARHNDFASMYANCFGHTPQDPRDETYRQIKHEWDVFTRHPATATFVVEDRSRPKNERVCGCGQMVFVRQELADWAHQTQKPGINREAARKDVPYLLDLRQMERANSSKGLVGLVTRWHSGTEGRFPESFRAGVRAVLYRGMMDFFLGYNFREIIGETNGHQAFQYAQDTGFVVLNSFDGYYSATAAPEPRFGLVHVTREQASQNDATRISQLFVDYRPPRLHLNAASRELLQLAMLGYGDADIADLTGVSLKGIQKRWYALSELERHYPSVRRLITGNDESVDQASGMPASHGAVNRHLWIQFVQRYREEIRPHAGTYFKRVIEKEKFAAAN